VRALGAEGGGRVSALLVFTPLVALASPLPVVVAALLRRRAVAAAAAGVVVVFALLVGPRALPGPVPAVRDGLRLKVMTFNNLEGGAAPGDLIALIRAQRPDLVSLQELTPGELAALDARGLRRMLPFRDAQSRDGANGAGLFSRWPLTPRADPGAVGVRVQPRDAVRAPGAPPLEVQLVHLPSPQGQTPLWRRMLDQVGRSARASDALQVFAGDFNATLDHHELRRVLAHDTLVDAADAAGAGLRMTWPADRWFPPLMAIDHVLVDPRIAVRGLRTFRVPGSDHRAVLAALELPRG
jgi:endonuclease/exonuclease/phosphatase (EEP) superfamily protein YafD